MSAGAASDAGLLRVRGLRAGYHGFEVIQGIDLDARPGLTVVVGPNGAGKTTMLKAICGLIGRKGEVSFDGQVLPDAKPHMTLRSGVAMVAEGRQLFPEMEVLENLELGGWLLSRAEREQGIERAFALFPRLRERARQRAGTMSGGEQQMLAVARALMTRPRALLLDEPSLGLAPRMVDELLDTARRVGDEGVTVLMVEQNVRKALKRADRGYVIERGGIVAQGAGADLLGSDMVRGGYLGASVG